MTGLKFLFAGLLLSMTQVSRAAPVKGRYFDRAIIVIFENTDYRQAIQQPFFAELAARGAQFSDFRAISHPSQPNYIALASGSTAGVRGDGSVTVNVSNLADLLEARGLTWKVYAEGFPGHCYLGGATSGYARKHNPFISFSNIQSNPARCANIVGAQQFDLDANSGNLPDFVFFVPNQRNSGHDTGVAFADRWYRQSFSRRVNDPQFMQNTVLISTFDESGGGAQNQIYTSIVGPAVMPVTVNSTHTLYGLLRLMEDNWDLGSLNKEDYRATAIPMIWSASSREVD